MTTTSSDLARSKYGSTNSSRRPVGASTIGMLRFAARSFTQCHIIRGCSHWFRRRELLDLDPTRALLSLPQVIGHLVAQPRFGGAPARLFQPNRHLGSDAVMTV